MILPMLSLSLLGACRGPEPAPDQIEQLLGWMFQHADDDDTEAFLDGTAKAQAWLDGHFDATLEGYVIDPLTEEQLDAVGAGDRDRSQIRGVALGYPYTANVDQVAAEMMARRVNAVTDTADQEECTLVEGEPEGFSVGTCDWVVWDVDQVTDLGFGISLETWIRYQYRWLETEEGDALMLRAWSQQTPEITTDLFTVLQTYQLWLLLPEDGAWRSIQGEWVDARVGDSGLDMDFVMQVWINGLRDTEARLNEGAAGAE